MVCIYCSSKTQVTNSRPQKRLGRTWRRRECSQCGAVFTSIEAPDLAASLRVRLPNGKLAPFERDKLFMSVVQALGHRTDAVSASTALIDTITANVLQTAQEASVELESIKIHTAAVLEAFDTVGATYYRAYHKLLGED